MKEKFEVEITLQGEGRAVTKMLVTQSQYKLLQDLADDVNDPYQEAYSPNMYVRIVNN